MSCVAVATSPALTAPSIRSHRDDHSTHLGDARISSQCAKSLDVMLPPSPKLSTMISLCKSSTPPPPPPPPHPSSSISLPSPRVLCSPRTPSWTSPIGTPTSRASSCLCGGFSICSSCSCTLASSSPADCRWRSFSERRSSSDGLAENSKFNGANVAVLDGPSSARSNATIATGGSILGSSNGGSFLARPCPSPRYTSSTTPRMQLHAVVEAPSPRFGGGNNLPSFSSTRLPRPLPGNPKIHSSALDESGNKENADVGNLGSWISGARDLFRLDIPKEQEEPSEPLVVSNGGGEGTGHSGRPSTPPLKRKRPPKLEIPSGANLVLPNNMPHVLDLCEEAISEMTVEGSYYGISCKKGRREHLEDTQRAIPDLNGDPKQAFFGVFDGHGGRKAADFAAEKLAQNIIDAMASSSGGEGYMEAAVRAGYLTTDAEFLEKRISSGASCVTAMMKDGYMVVANAGDCRAVLSRAGNAEALTSDHRAGREDERHRIEKLGGYVDNLTGTWRVQGVLAVSRGIGDLHLKEWISAEPEVQKLRITPDCEFLILASDGLWDSVTNQEAVDFARSILKSAKVLGESIPVSMPKATSVRPVGRENSETRLKTELDKGAEASSKEKSSSNGQDDVDICVKSTEAEVLDSVVASEGSPAFEGPVAACKRLIEISIERGCHDDISILVIDLAHFKQNS